MATIRSTDSTDSDFTTFNVENVCNFLQLRNVSNSVVDFFRNQKIDGRVICLLSDKQLSDYGLTTIGDRMTLREKCRAISQVQTPPTDPSPNVVYSERLPSDQGISRRRQELLAILRNKNGESKYSSNIVSSRPGRPKKSVRSVTVGLRLLAESPVDGERQSTIVHSPLGEKNTIALQLPMDADYDGVLSILKDAFFPNRENPVIGTVTEFDFEIVNARNNNIQKDAIPFSLAEYVAVKKIPGTPKIFLLCTPLCNENELENSSLEEEILGVFMEEETKCDNSLSENTIMTDNQYFEFQATSPSGEVLINTNTINLNTDLFEDHNTMINTGIPEEVNLIVDTCIDDIQQKNILDPVEIIRYIQSHLVTGRQLNIEDESCTLTGETNFILVDRTNLIQTSFAEIKSINNLRTTLEVQFYGEMAEDLGGPRNEFFTMVLHRIKEEYFDPVREWSKDYKVIGNIFALTIFQNGKLPRVMSSEIIELLFNESPTEKQYIEDLRSGLNALGLYKLTCHIPALRALFTPGGTSSISLKMLMNLLKPSFSPDGSNMRREESKIYSVFIQYLREAASGRRGNINLSSILRFVTGCEEEPVLGFSIHPSIHFTRSADIFPTANTCINKLTLPIQDVLPDDNEIFKRYDYAFANAYFGMV